MRNIELVYRGGFAAGALSLLVFFFGHIGLLGPAYMAFSLAAAALFFALSARRALKTPPPSEKRAPFSVVETLLLAGILAVIIAVIPLAATPPSVRDELIQHLAVPKLYAARGRIFELEFMGFSYFPQNIGLLYLIPLSFGNDIAPRFMHFGFALLTAFTVYLYLLRSAGRAWGLLGALIYLSTPLVFNLSRMAYIDHGVAFYSVLSMVAALEWRRDFSRKWLVYSAVSMGLALGAKYNAIIGMGLIAAFIVFTTARKSPLKAFRDGFLFVAVALLLISPWLVRNYAWTGSPFYPVYEWAARAASKGEGFHITGELTPLSKRFLLYKESAAEIASVPLRIFWEGRDNSIEKFDGVLNPVLLIFLPFAFVKRRYGDLVPLALYAFVFFFIAFFTVDIVTRYLLPVFPAVVIIVTWSIKDALEPARLKYLAVTFVIALFAYNGLYLKGLYDRYRPFSYVSGAQSRHEYLAGTLPDYEAVTRANSMLPEGAKVMLLFSGERGYYWEREYFYGDRRGLFFKGLVKSSPDKDGLMREFARRGITHLFLNEVLFERFANDNFGSKELSALADFFDTRSIRLFSSGGFSLFELRRSAGPGPGPANGKTSKSILKER